MSDLDRNTAQVLRHIAEQIASSPDRIGTVHESLLHAYLVSPGFRADIDFHAITHATRH